MLSILKTLRITNNEVPVNSRGPGRIQSTTDNFMSLRYCELTTVTRMGDSQGLPLASFRRYELSEDTLAQICEADNSAHQPMRKVDEEGRRRRYREGRIERAAAPALSPGRQIIPRLIIRALHAWSGLYRYARHVALQSAFLPSWQPTPEGINARGTSTRLSPCVDGIYRFAERI